MVAEGRLLVAFMGKRNVRKKDNQVLFYITGGRWQVAEIEDIAKPKKWTWTLDTQQEYFGTFNGRIDRLIEIIEDYNQGRYYFPSVPLTRFSPRFKVGKLPGPGRGIALYDLNQDGYLDIYACSLQGNRLFLGTKDPNIWKDATKEAGLDGFSSSSVSIADVNVDGYPDLLLDGSLLLGTSGGNFVRNRMFQKDRAIKMGTFVDINHDGYPDILLSLVEGGLEIWMNSTTNPGEFTDVTSSSGWRSLESCNKGTGYVFWGDLNQDGRIDLFYGVEPGLILLQSKDEQFSPTQHFGNYIFSSPEQEKGMAGQGCFAPLWRKDKWDIVTASDESLILLTMENHELLDVTGLGNEIADAIPSMGVILAEDLNGDGLVDLYVVSRKESPSILYENRGYGSFMASLKYDPNIFSCDTYRKGAGGVVSGDVNRDGYNDLVVVGHDGMVSLLFNHSSSLREPKEHSTIQEQRLANTRILTLRLAGKKGILGSIVKLKTAQGKTIAMRMIGSQAPAGCRGPDEVNLAVLDPGIYTLQIQWADGGQFSRDLDLTSSHHQRILIEKEKEK